MKYFYHMIRLSPTLLYLLILAVGLLPFQNSVLPSLLPTSELWNDWGWLMTTVLVFTIFSLGKELFTGMNKGSVHLILGGSIGILVISTFSQGSFEKTLTLLTILWFAILFGNLSRAQQALFSFVLLGILAIYAQWGVLQFSLQRDLGFQYLGESDIAFDLPAVAKFSSDYTELKLVRAYGPYPHSNPYAGAALLGLVLSIWLLPMRPQSRNLARILRSVLLGLFSLAIILSFSRAAILGLLLIPFLLRVPMSQKIVPLIETRKFVVILGIILLLFSPLLLGRAADPEDQALTDRVSGVRLSLNIIREHAFMGVGLGNYTTFLKDYLVSRSISADPWDIAPVHSVPLLVVSEFGLVLSALLLLFTAWKLYQLQSFRLLFLAPVFPLLLLDHFYYTQTFSLLLLILTTLLLVSRSYTST